MCTGEIRPSEQHTLEAGPVKERAGEVLTKALRPVDKERSACALAVIPLPAEVDIADTADQPFQVIHDVVNGMTPCDGGGVGPFQPGQECVTRAETVSPLLRRPFRTPQVIKRIGTPILGGGPKISCGPEFARASKTLAFDTTRTVEIPQVSVGLAFCPASPLLFCLLRSPAAPTAVLGQASLYCFFCQEKISNNWIDVKIDPNKNIASENTILDKAIKLRLSTQ